MSSQTCKNFFKNLFCDKEMTQLPYMEENSLNTTHPYWLQHNVVGFHVKVPLPPSSEGLITLANSNTIR